ncbi:hypothetical protein GJ496_002322 [Pomphorhynchus laevis]|nr:hypothetical protein GJ496_002322 [Pomphorhynchus laevis]
MYGPAKAYIYRYNDIQYPVSIQTDLKHPLEQHCLNGIQFINIDKETKISWSLSGYQIEDHEISGVSVNLIVFSICNLTNYRLALTQNDSICTGITTFYKLREIRNQTWFTIISTRSNGDHFLCLSENNTEIKHQGTDPLHTFNVKFTNELIIPLAIKIVLIVICQILAALLSGLNLGLLSLDLSDLKILCETGTYREKYYANKIYPIRKHGNYLLCSIVIAQTLFNAINTLIIDSITGGIIATIIATFMITIFGEILPQAICARFGLIIAAVTAPFTWFIMIITAPFSWTFGKILDKVLGTTSPLIFTRENISFMLKEHVLDLGKIEQRIVEGVLDIRSKPIMQHMTKLKDTFMLDYEDRFDDNLFIKICDSGFSRIPVHKGSRSNIVGVVHVKDLALLDTSTVRTIGMISDAFNLPYDRCQATDMLSVLLENIGKRKSHMSIVENIYDDKPEAVGIITIEDVLESLLSCEIYDEHEGQNSLSSDISSWRARYKNIQLRMPSNFKAGAIQFLSSLAPFSDQVMTSTNLSKLVHKCYLEKHDKTKQWLMKKDNVNEHFLLILSGIVNVESGKEMLKHDAGPYCYFGLLALSQPDVAHVPDFSLYTDSHLQYIWISIADWKEAQSVKAVDDVNNALS